jgi:hypothetical protein
LTIVPMRYGGGEGGQGEKRGRERVVRDQLTPLIRPGGERGGGRANSHIMCCFHLRL